MECLPVEMEGVSKSFGNHRAVEDLSLVVPEGQLYGIIGPNGSGKTTTLRMILGIIEPDSGQLAVYGRRSHPAANDDVAYLPEERGIYRKLTVMRQLTYFGQLKGMSGRAARAAATDWLDRLGLAGWGKLKVESLSKGMSQKVQFIATILSRPRLLVLDEPFTGLDPVNMEVMKEVILELRDQGSTILFSTHNMDTAELMCDRICMIYQGRKVLDDPLATIKQRYRSPAVRLVLGEGNGFSPADMAGVTVLRQQGRLWEVMVEGDEQALLRHAVQAGSVQQFNALEPSLHDIFVKIARPKPEEIQSMREGEVEV
jgi:ABC-2 type transport system ATP-binding protein